MKKILKEGKKSLLLPDDEGGALSGEVHLIEHENKKYVVRICSDLKKAKYYEDISKKLEKKEDYPCFLRKIQE